MNVKNYYQGKINKAQGELFEQLIDAACLHYWSNKEAQIDKTPEPFRVTRPLGNGKFEGFYQKEAQPDYKGTLKGGRSVVFEAKHTSSDRIMQDAVKLHQAQHLESSSELGAVCFVLVSLGGGFYRVPWEDWKNLKELYGHKYLNQQEIEKYKVPYKRGIVAFLDNL